MTDFKITITIEKTFTINAEDRETAIEEAMERLAFYDPQIRVEEIKEEKGERK